MIKRRTFLNRIPWARLVTGGCALAVLILGITVMAGWHAGHAGIVRLREDLVPMGYLTAAMFTACGTGLAATAFRIFPRTVPVICGAGTLALAGALVIEFLSGWSLGLESLLRSLPSFPLFASSRPFMPASWGFILCGLSLLLLGNAGLFPRLRRPLIWVAGTLVLSLGAMGLCAYALGFKVLFITGGSTGMAVHTAAGLAILGIGLLATQWIGAGRLLEDRLLPVPVALGTMAVSLMLWQAMAADRSRGIREQAEVVAKSVANDSLDRFQFVLRSLERIRMRWEQDGGTTPYREWRADARACMKEEPVCRAIGRTDASWRADWVEPDANGSPYTGQDFHQETRWKSMEPLEQSLKSRRPVVSPTLALHDGSRGFLIYLPMFPNGEFDGFLFGVFRLKDLQQSAMAEPAFSACRIAFFENNELIAGDLPRQPAGEGTAAEVTVDFYRHKWRFVVEPESATLASIRLPVVTLGLGSLLSLALAAAVWWLQEASVRNRRLKKEIQERLLAERQQQASEERLAQVLDSAIGVSVIAADNEGKVTYFSKGAECLAGYSAAEMLGRKSCSMLHDPDEMAARAAELSQELGCEISGIDVFTAIPLRNGSERREWTYVRRDGSRRIVDLMVTVLDGTAGGLQSGFLGTAVDITDRKRMERELRELLRNRKATQALQESAGRIARMGHWEMVIQGKRLSWSDMTCKILEVPPGTVLPLDKAIELYHPEDRLRISGMVENSIATGEPFEGEARLIAATGRQKWIYIRGESVQDESGGVLALHGIIQDIDDRYKDAELLKQRNIQLEAATRRAEADAKAKAEFLANMSHEIRTPLNAVIGMSELLMDGQLDAREREFVETIHNSGDVLLSLINDILDFSKIESGQLDLERIPVHLRDCVESVLDLLAGHAAKKKLDLMCWIDPEAPEAILSDPTRLRQVLVNLVGNAVKFTNKGEVFLKISITRQEAGNFLHAAVSDTGIGIPESQRSRLFSAFSQVDASTTRRFGGTGLGLAISHRLIQNMGGRIWVESAEGKGSIFHFEIPLLPVEIPSSAAMAMVTANPGPSAMRNLAGLRILIVDDNATNRWVLKMQIESWGMVPVTAENAAQALEQINAGERFDLAIVDVIMPGMDGYELAAEIRRHRSEQELPILVLTSVGERGRDSKSLGLSGVLTKPVKVLPLFNAVRNILTAAYSPRKAAADSPSDDQPGAARPLRILVAEDNPVNQRVVNLHLNRMGYSAITVSNGLEALHAVEEGEFDVILMDVQMPGMDGMEAAREICRRYPPDTRPWMIALTANALGSDRDECLAAGMDDYLSKPVRSENLLRALRTAYHRGEAVAG
ncbi:MAG: multi-sensor hybrid histidine kinase [Verrucomicrobiales bacterium]|nr:multi-sensor hybrid histidine kinase [Verrucomicrobiales bacterium]